MPFVRGHLDYLRNLTPERSRVASANKVRYAQAIWETLHQIEGKDPRVYRLCSQGTFMVAWSEFEKMTQCGWFIRDGKAVASITLDRG